MSQNQHEADLRLARVLQEQEQAFHALMEAAVQSPYKPTSPAGRAAHHQQQFAYHQRASSATGSEGGGSGADADAEDALLLEGEGLTDEELARRLQSQEEEQFYAATGGRPGAAAGDAGPGYGGLELQLEEDEEGGVDYDHLSYEDLSLLGDVAGAVSKGLAADTLAALPVLTAREFLRTQRRGSSAAACSCAVQQHGSCGCAPAARAMCVVCQCDFEDSDVLKLLPACRHAYHADCIAGWLAHNKTCPICHKEVQAQDAKAAATQQQADAAGSGACGGAVDTACTASERDA